MSEETHLYRKSGGIHIEIWLDLIGYISRGKGAQNWPEKSKYWQDKYDRDLTPYEAESECFDDALAGR